MNGAQMGLPEALERAAQALRKDAGAIRPANGDPARLAEQLGPAGSARVLAWLLANEPEAGEELAAAWADDPDGAGQALLKLDAGSLPKPARKILRRIVHGLRTRGVAVPEEAPAERVATLAPADDSIDEARVTGFDGRGARVVSLAASHPGGGVRLFQIAIDDARGVLDFEVLTAARRDVRRWLRESARADSATTAALTPASARALVAHAAARHPAGRTLPRGFAEWRSRVAEAPEGAKTPGELVREALEPAADAAAACRRVAEWLRAGELGPWPPDVAWLRQQAQRIADAKGGVVVVSQAARQDQVARALDEAAQELAAGESGAVFAWRLDEQAWLWWQGGREADARECLAAAGALREPGAAREALWRACVEHWLAPVLRDAPPREEAQPDLLVRP